MWQRGPRASGLEVTVRLLDAGGHEPQPGIA
jgi:hypothetical protein